MEVRFNMSDFFQFIEKVQEDVKIYSPLEKRNKALEEKRARDSMALEQQRQDIINEVINSERAYVKTLNIVVVVSISNFNFCCSCIARTSSDLSKYTHCSVWYHQRNSLLCSP